MGERSGNWHLKGMQFRCCNSKTAVQVKKRFGLDSIIRPGRALHYLPWLDNHLLEQKAKKETLYDAEIQYSFPGR